MTKPTVSRRSFVRGSAAAAGACACAATGLAGCHVSNTAAKPVAAQPAQDGRISLGAAADLALGQQLKVSIPGVGDPVLVARVSETEVRAVSISCTHWGSEVVLVLDDAKFRCDAHGSEFALDGKVLEGPASDPLPAYEVVEEQGQLFLIRPRQTG